MADRAHEHFAVGEGPAVRVSLSLPEGTAEAIRSLTGKREFSSFVAEAVERAVRRRLLREELDQYQADHGEFTPDELAWADAALNSESHEGRGGHAA